MRKCSSRGGRRESSERERDEGWLGEQLSVCVGPLQCVLQTRAPGALWLNTDPPGGSQEDREKSTVPRVCCLLVSPQSLLPAGHSNVSMEIRDITQKGYEKKRSKLIRAFVPHAGGMEGPMSHRTPLGPPSAARFHRRRTSGARDERYRSDVHTEAVQAVLARHVERKVPCKSIVMLGAQLQPGCGIRRCEEEMATLPSPSTERGLAR
ncbi:unnamed protein product [Boreogadus saida]